MKFQFCGYQMEFTVPGADRQLQVFQYVNDYFTVDVPIQVQNIHMKQSFFAL